MHVYRVFTQVISPAMRDGIFRGEEPKDEVEVEAGIGNVEEAASGASIGGGIIPRRHGFNVVNINIASIAYSSPVLFMVHEGQAVDGASFTSSVPIVPRQN